MGEVAHLINGLRKHDPRAIGRAISIVEDGGESAEILLSSLDESLIDQTLVLGITGPPGAGKSTLTSQIISHFRKQGIRLGVIAIDPSSPISGGAILGDRIRMMRHALDQDVVVRSMAARGRLGGLCSAAAGVVRVMANGGCSTIIIETVGVGQSEMDIVRLADITAMVLAPGLGDDIQAMKAGLLEVADLLVVNKADRPGAEMLAMDMEAMIRNRKSTRDTPVCRTVATEGTGVSDLVAAIGSIDQRHRASGEHHLRRKKSFQLEVIDRALEIIRPELLSTMKDLDGKHELDPGRTARRLVGLFRFHGDLGRILEEK